MPAPLLRGILETYDGLEINSFKITVGLGVLTKDFWKQGFQIVAQRCLDVFRGEHSANGVLKTA